MIIASKPSTLVSVGEPAVETVTESADVDDVEGAREAPSLTPPAGFQVCMEGVSLIDALQLLHFSGRSVRLLLESEESGLLDLEQGELVHVRLGALMGEAALRAVLSLTHGAARTVPLPKQRPRTIARRFQSLMLDSLRILDELSEAAERDAGARETLDLDDLLRAGDEQRLSLPPSRPSVADFLLDRAEVRPSVPPGPTDEEAQAAEASVERRGRISGALEAFGPHVTVAAVSETAVQVLRGQAMDEEVACFLRDLIRDLRSDRPPWELIEWATEHSAIAVVRRPDGTALFLEAPVVRKLDVQRFRSQVYCLSTDEAGAVRAEAEAR